MDFAPYLFFVGTCREAFTRYHEVLGGTLDLVTAADMPADEQPPGVDPDLIMHAALVVDGRLLMGSDDPTADAPGPKLGMRVSLTVGDGAEAERAFAALAEGGEVEMPLAATSWAPSFGMCTDRFGTPWMISAAAPDA